MRVRFLGWEDPVEKEIAHTPVLLTGKFHRQRNLVGYTPWDHKELDMTERLSMHSWVYIAFFLNVFITYNPLF